MLDEPKLLQEIESFVLTYHEILTKYERYIEPCKSFQILNDRVADVEGNDADSTKSAMIFDWKGNRS